MSLVSPDRLRRAAIVGLLAMSSLVQAAQFTSTGSLFAPRQYFSAVLLPNGKVLADGGDQGSPSRSVEIYDPATGQWSAAGSPKLDRIDHTTTLLPNGKVLIAGGDEVDTAEIYDPATGLWSDAGTLSALRNSATATVLQNGKVIVAGGNGLDGDGQASVDIYDPATGLWSGTGALNFARVLHSATLLPNGKVLVAAGLFEGDFTKTAELYDPVSGHWSNTGSMANARCEHTATLMTNGKVLVIGGEGVNGSILNTAEIYDPATGLWSAGGSLTTARMAHTATLLPNGRVLVAGGDGTTGGLSSVEIYDPLGGTASSAGSLVAARCNHVAVLLAGGQVLVAGGTDLTTRPHSPMNSAEIYDPAGGSSSVANGMHSAQSNHTSTLLPDGKVLATGGTAGGSALTVAETYDWTINSWSDTDSMGAARFDHTATLLPNGKVLVAAGTDGSGVLKSAEFYDPVSGHWSGTGGLGEGRSRHTATLLGNGQILVTGGSNDIGPLGSAEIYDSGVGLWKSTGALNFARSYHTATLLYGGKVLVAGGFDGAGSLASAEIYDLATGAWSGTGGLLTARRNHTATLLPSGKVFVAGGFDSTGNVLNSAEIYDPVSGLWSVAGNLNAARANHTATPLLNGVILLEGGVGNGGVILNSGEGFNPATSLSTATGNLLTARKYHAVTLLPGGKALVTGGSGSSGELSSAEVYDTGQAFIAAARPVISIFTSPLGDGGTLSVTGTNFRGLSGAGDGTTHDGSCNYPLAQLRSLETGQTTFLLSSAATGHGWSATAFTSAPVRGFIPGYAALTIFAAGTPSKSVITRIVGPTNADLSNLTLSAGTLLPAFAADAISYMVSVPDSVTSTTVTPTVLNAGSTVKINGVPVASGSASQSIPLLLGDNPIAVVVTAADGVTTKTYTTTVTVHDVTAPVITFHSSDLTAEATGPDGAVVTYAAAMATDNSGASPVITCSTASGAIFPLGPTTVTVTAKDVAQNASTATFNVLVQDTTPPAITVLGSNPATAFQGAAYRDAGATASDLVSGAVAVTTTGTVNIEVLGSNTVTYHSTDAAGNTTTATRTVNVVTAPAGTVQAFDPGLLQAGGAAGTVRAVAQQTDGKLLIAGRFDQAGGEPHANLARFNANGTVDSQFTAGTDGAVNSVVVQPDGQILLGGSFALVNNQASGRIARLNADGSLESTETFHAGTGADGEVKKVVLQADGKILLAGLFGNVNGEGRASLARLLPNGTLESTATFDPGAGADGPIREVAEQLDGRIVIVGDFTHVDGASCLGLASLNADGSVQDASAFHTFTSIDGAISALTVQRDGHILIGGDFTGLDGQLRGHIARLFSDGTIEDSTTFNPGTGADGSVRSIALQANGAILLGGDFAQVNTQARSRIARLNADGTVQDVPAFNAGADGVIDFLALEGDGRLVMGGGFKKINGETRNGFGYWPMMRRRHL